MLLNLGTKRQQEKFSRTYFQKQFDGYGGSTVYGLGRIVKQADAVAWTGDAIHPVRWGQMRRSKEAKSSCRNQRETTDAVRPFDGCSKCYSEAVYMLDKQTRGAILLLRSKSHSLSRISRLLSLSRNSSVPTFARQV